MKEGYLQIKISELNDKCKEIDQMLSMEKSKIKLLEEKVGGFKELIKKLQDLNEFEEKILKKIKKENQEIFSEEIKAISDKISKNIDNLVKNKLKEIEDIFDYMKNREREIDSQTELTNKLNKKVKYLLNYNNFLMMKLVNKGFLSDREVNELHLRSSKKSD